MKAKITAALLALLPLVCQADVVWKDFEFTGYNEKPLFTLGEFTCGLSATKDPERDHGESLQLTVRSGDMRERTVPFKSSYGMASVAIDGELLLLKYGIGRGTFARTEHLKVFKIADSLIELGDFPISYWHEKAGKSPALDPDLFTASVEVKRAGKSAVLSITHAKDSPEHPPDLEIRIGD